MFIKPKRYTASDTPMQPHHPHCLLIRLICCTAFIFFCAGTAIADTNRISIVADIAPVHSLVTMVVGQQADIDLLIPPSQSPHSVSLKPSQLRLMNKANLIVILSDDFTPALSRHLTSVGRKAVILKLSDTNAKPHIDKHDEQNLKNENHNNVGKALDVIAPAAHIDDAHTWLNPENAVQWIDLIASAAIQLDEQNQATYQSNANRAKAELTALHESLKTQLTTVQSVPYIVYHDAYQHFAHGFGLQKPIAIALSDARAPGAKKLRAIRAEVEQTGCVFSEILHDDIIVDTVTKGLSVKRAILDPMGSSIPLGPTHYPQLMHALANTFNACLN